MYGCLHLLKKKNLENVIEIIYVYIGLNSDQSGTFYRFKILITVQSMPSLCSDREFKVTKNRIDSVNLISVNRISFSHHKINQEGVNINQ